MKIAVVGVGAVGGLIAARLAAAGHEVSALARGATLAALRDHGLRLRADGIETRADIRASDDAADFGPQQLVIVAVKGPALARAAQQIQPLIGKSTVVMPAMNGVAWWFLRAGVPGSPAFEAPLASVDPGGPIAALLPLRKVLGCVIHLSCSSPAPGVVQHGFGDRLIVGEPAGGTSDRVAQVCDALCSAGFSAEASPDIRRDIWFKLWGNMTMNPVSALTLAPCDRILDDPLVAAFMLDCMAEAAAIGERIGCPIRESGADRMNVARKLGSFKTSMLQDLEAGRALEIDSLVSAVHEIGARVGVATPNIAAPSAWASSRRWTASNCWAPRPTPTKA